jgi:hypothetical protein
MHEDDFFVHKNWCNRNCKDWVHWYPDHGYTKWLFSSKEEATQFYLTWATDEV